MYRASSEHRKGAGAPRGRALPRDGLRRYRTHPTPAVRTSMTEQLLAFDGEHRITSILLFNNVPKQTLK
ncbi:hypothetical protein F0U61_31625 [Archangium violaceum]|uniref:hypothetical protein n=1 Tax=Archangium violaceum TaxID=83451 RepID=UPI002B31D474|nr:hypothetical protein F0U61_31625 [Archangium violaceum]